MAACDSGSYSAYITDNGTFIYSSSAAQTGFGLALRQALACCSEDSSRAILNGACLDVRDSKLHYVVGTNGRYLFSANSFCFDLKKSVVIPDSKFVEWPDLLDEEPASLSVETGEEAQPARNGEPAKDATAGWVKLESGRWTFITKEIFGEFPNWKQVVPINDARWTRVNLSEEAIKQLVLVTPNLPGDDGLNHPERLKVTADRLIVEGRNRDDEDWTSIPVDAAVKGKPRTVGLNRSYLLNALRFGLNEIEMEDPLSPVVFSKGGKKMIIMPVNLDGPKVTATTPAPASSGATTPTAAPPAAEQTTPQEQPGAQTERTDMPRTARATTPGATTTTPPVETVPANNGNGYGNGSAVKSLVDHVEQIKENLKNVIRDLNGVIDTVKLADKEKKATDKEIEAVRIKLRQIQNVTI